MDISGDLIPVGKISAAFGIKGWVKVFSFTDPVSNILKYKPLYMSRGGQWIEVEVTGGHQQGKGVVMAIANVTDRDQVTALIGTELAVPRAQLMPAEDDEFYWADLVGSTVVNLDDEDLGIVDHLLETGRHDVLVIKAENREPRLIPFVMDEIIKSVDLDNKTIRVDWQVDY